MTLSNFVLFVFPDPHATEIQVSIQDSLNELWGLCTEAPSDESSAEGARVGGGHEDEDGFLTVSASG